MSEETEGDMAAAELAAEAERDNTPAPLPPCGPERDAVTAAIDAVWESRSIADRRAAINALITAARADERAQLAVRATEQEREMVDEMDLATELRAKDAGMVMLAATGIIGELRAERDALVKRVRELEEAVAIERERRIVTGGTMAEHIADVRAAFSEGAQCAGLSEDGALEMWQHSAALGNLRDTGAFEQALAGRKGET